MDKHVTESKERKYGVNPKPKTLKPNIIPPAQGRNLKVIKHFLSNLNDPNGPWDTGEGEDENGPYGM